MKNKCIFLCLSLLLCGCNNEISTSINSSSSEYVISIQGPSFMNVGEVALFSINYDSEVIWESSDSLIIEINSKGEAVSFKEGKVIISAKNKEMKILATLDVEVGYKVSYPKNELDLINLFNKAIELENEISTSKLTIILSEIEQTYTQEVEMYEDFYINVTNDEYTNYSGYHNEKSIDFVGIKGDYFYDISDGNVNSYGIKRKIVNSNATDYEILELEAKKRSQSPRFISSFYNKLADSWGGRTLDINIKCSDTQDGFKVELSNTYLFVWANGIDNDSKYYSAELFFNNAGNFLNGTFELKVYEESQYDVKNNKWKENAKIKSIEVCQYESVLGVKKNNNEANLVPEDYFVKSVTYATYETTSPLKIGDRIIRDNIVLKEYEGSKAVDTKNILIKGIKNSSEEVVIVEDTLNGGYVIMNTGKAYLICQMMYSSDVTFLVEITVS